MNKGFLFVFIYIYLLGIITKKDMDDGDDMWWKHKYERFVWPSIVAIFCFVMTYGVR